MYLIQYRYSNAFDWEDIDNALDQETANYLLAEYSTAYQGLGQLRIIEV